MKDHEQYPTLVPRFRTLTGRFGSLYAFILLVVAAVCAVVWLQLSQIQTDSARVMEETRELGVLVEVRSTLAAAKDCWEDPDYTGVDELNRLRQLLSPIAANLMSMDSHNGDPSRTEHQRAENRLLDSLVSKLEELNSILATDEAAGLPDSFIETLSVAAHIVEVLHRETLKEAHEADYDLSRRADGTRIVMIVTVLAALLFLAAALVSIHMGVVRPLHVLRDGAERFGRGDLKHRIHLHNHDELAQLADTLNGMAVSLSDSKEHLEERVRTRTREFIRAARLADLGILASGVAHEVNTPLGSILSCAEGLQRRLRDDKLSRDLLEDYSKTITCEVSRARAITTRMLALVRQEPSSQAEVSLQLILDQARSALGYKADRKNVKLVVEDLAEDVRVFVNAGELVQIIVNLLSNAIDASDPGGSVALHLELSPGSFVLIVDDDGCGIPEQDFDQILDPFFTTKSPEEGTGLGLALVGNLVRSHRGQLSFENKKSGGARFKVSLPMDWSTKA